MHIPPFPRIDEYAHLTKRELFSAMAMQAHLTADPELSPSVAAAMAVDEADALLAELAKAKSP